MVLKALSGNDQADNKRAQGKVNYKNLPCFVRSTRHVVWESVEEEGQVVTAYSPGPVAGFRFVSRN